MIVDARSLPPGESIDADLCIIGAGAAGITIAREIAGSGQRVCLLESGGYDFDGDTQNLYAGETVGASLPSARHLAAALLWRHDQPLGRLLPPARPL